MKHQKKLALVLGAAFVVMSAAVAEAVSVDWPSKLTAVFTALLQESFLIAAI